MSEVLKKAYISGTGFYVPDKVLTNADLEKMVDTSDEWITTRTGIKERRIAEKDVTSSMIGAKAAEKALKNAKITPEEIDLIIGATITPDMVFPSTAALIQTEIGAKNAACFDLEAACSGFIYSLMVAKQFIATGEYKNILVVGTEVLSKITDWDDRNTCVLFGDGAGAAVISESNTESEIIANYLGADGSYKELLYMPGGGSLYPATEETVKNRLHYIKMRGNETYKVAVTKMTEAAEIVLEKAGIKKSDVAFLIPHQANVRIIQSVQKRLDLKDEQVIINLDKYGNTSGATIPIALAEAVEQGRIKRGDILVFVAFGGGLTWGASVIRW